MLGKYEVPIPHWLLGERNSSVPQLWFQSLLAVARMVLPPLSYLCTYIWSHHFKIEEPLYQALFFNPSSAFAQSFPKMQQSKFHLKLVHVGSVLSQRSPTGTVKTNKPDQFSLCFVREIWAAAEALKRTVCRQHHISYTWFISGRFFFVFCFVFFTTTETRIFYRKQITHSNQVLDSAEVDGIHLEKLPIHHRQVNFASHADEGATIALQKSY